MDLFVFVGRHGIVLLVLAGTAWAAGRLACRALRIAPSLALAPPPAPASAPTFASTPVFAPTPALTPASGPADAGALAPAAALGLAPLPSPARWAISVALGLALLAQLLLLIALVGWLRVSVIVGGMLGVHAAALATGDWSRATWRTWSAWSASAARAARAALTGAPARTGAIRRDSSAIGTAGNSDLDIGFGFGIGVGIAIGVGVAIVLLPILLLALYPPVGFDETMYHLPFARAFAASGGAPFLPGLRFPVFPQLAEMVNAAVLLLAGDVATQLVGVLALGACAALVFAWARECSSAAGGWLAAAILVGSPIALYLATSGYVEPQVALFGLASLYAVERGREEGRLGWIVAAGLLAGSAAAVKYLGLFFVPAAAALLVRRAFAGGSGMPSSMLDRRDLAVYSIAAAAAIIPTYGHIVAYTGNPVFPFYPEIFGTSAWEAQRFLGVRGVARLGPAATLLWDVTFRRYAVGGLPFFSPGLPLGIPVAIVGGWREPRLRWPLLIAFAYVFVAPPQSHYFVAIAPLFCIVIGAGAAGLLCRHETGRHEAGRRVLLGVALALALGGEAYVVYRLHRFGPLPVTADARERWLTAEQPLYAAIAFTNRTEGPVTIYGIDAEQMGYYAAGSFLGDHNGPASYGRVEARAQTLNSLASALDEAGASHLLLPARAAASWRALAAADRRLTPIYEDSRATVYRVLPSYRVLPPPANSR